MKYENSSKKNRSCQDTNIRKLIESKIDERLAQIIHEEKEDWKKVFIDGEITTEYLELQQSQFISFKDHRNAKKSLADINKQIEQWTDIEKKNNQRDFLELLKSKMRTLIDLGRLDEAFRIYEVLISFDGGNLDVHKKIMRGYELLWLEPITLSGIEENAHLKGNAYREDIIAKVLKIQDAIVSLAPQECQYDEIAEALCVYADNFKAAVTFLDRQINLISKHQIGFDAFKLGHCYDQKGSCLRELKEYKDALSSYQNAIKYFTEFIDAAELETKDIDNSKELLRKPVILQIASNGHINRLGIKELLHDAHLAEQELKQLIRDS